MEPTACVTGAEVLIYDVASRLPKAVKFSGQYAIRRVPPFRLGLPVPVQRKLMVFQPLRLWLRFPRWYRLVGGIVAKLWLAINWKWVFALKHQAAGRWKRRESALIICNDSLHLLRKYQCSQNQSTFFLGLIFLSSSSLAGSWLAQCYSYLRRQRGESWGHNGVKVPHRRCWISSVISAFPWRSLSHFLSPRCESSWRLVREFSCRA